MPWHIPETTLKEAPAGPVLLTTPGPNGESIIKGSTWVNARPTLFLDSDPRKLKLFAAQYQTPQPLGITRAKATQMPFQHRSFGCICSFEALFSIRPSWTVLAEFHRVLKPDGLLILFEPASHGFFSAIRDRLVGPGKRIFSSQELQQRLTRAGFEIISTESKPASADYPKPANVFHARKIDYPVEAPPEIITTRDLRAKQTVKKS